jgi:hypothetical protein
LKWKGGRGKKRQLHICGVTAGVLTIFETLVIMSRGCRRHLLLCCDWSTDGGGGGGAWIGLDVVVAFHVHTNSSHILLFNEDILPLSRFDFCFESK